MSIPALVIEAINNRPGESKTLRQPIRSEAALARLTVEALPMPAFRAIRAAGFSDRELSAVIPPRTLRHRIQKKEPLSTV